jgi:hypothetical protein
MDPMAEDPTFRKCEGKVNYHNNDSYRVPFLYNLFGFFMPVNIGISAKKGTDQEAKCNPTNCWKWINNSRDEIVTDY